MTYDRDTIDTTKGEMKSAPRLRLRAWPPTPFKFEIQKRKLKPEICRVCAADVSTKEQIEWGATKTRCAEHAEEHRQKMRKKKDDS